MSKDFIHFWVLPNNGFETKESLEPCLSGYLQKNPRVDVRVTVKTPSSLWNSLFLLLKRPEEFGAARPSLIQIPSHWTSTLAHWGLLEEIPDRDSELTTIVAPLRSHCVLEGTSRIFSWPWWMEVWVLYYRKDLLKRIQAQVPTRWQDFIACCEVMPPGLQKRYHLIAHPSESVSLADVAPGIWSRGGDLVSGDGSRSLLHREEVVEGIGAFLELMNRGRMPFLEKRGLAAENLFDGRAIFQFSGRFPRDLMKGKFARQVGAVPYPQVQKSSGVITAHHLAVVKGSSHVTEAFELMRHLSDERASDRYAEEIGAFTCREDWRAPLKDFSEIQETFRLSFDHARPLPNRMLMATLEKIFERSMKKLVHDIIRGRYRREDLKSALLVAAAEMDYVLEIQRGHASVS